MQCPYCQTLETKVIDSRQSQGESVRRRRKCENCDKRFTTFERIHLQIPFIVKNDGRRENFDKEKILQGLNKACQKRPVAADVLEQIADEVEKALVDTLKKEVPTDFVGELIMNKLYPIDPVAYVRFASFYWNYDDVESFIRGLMNRPDGPKIESAPTPLN